MQTFDLGDFVPRSYIIRFAVEGREYTFDVGDAMVDEVFRLLSERQEEHTVDRIRATVTEFLVKQSPEERREQLRADLAKIPYENTQGPSIVKLYTAIQLRYEPKKADGGR